MWIIDIYGFLVAGSLITIGTLGTGTAFIARLHVAAAVSVLGTIALATFVVLMLRHVRGSSESEGQGGSVMELKLEFDHELRVSVR